MNKMIRAILFAAAALLIAVVPACNTQKKAAATPGSSMAGEATSGYDAMVSSYTSWQRIRVPFNLRLIAPANFSIGGTATFERGKSIHLSLRMIGMEVAALQVTPDSLIVVEKMNRQYLAVPVAKALGGLDASIDNIQDLLTGRAFILGADSLTLAMKDRFKILYTDPGRPWLLTPAKQPSGVSYSFAVSPEGPLSSLTVEADKGPQINFTYSSPALVPSRGALDASMLISSELKGKDFRLIIDWDFSRARWDADVEPKSLTIGAGYRPLNVDALLKSLPASAK